MHEEASQDFKYYVEKYEAVRKQTSLSLQEMQTYKDIVGPLEIERRMHRHLRERGYLNRSIVLGAVASQPSSGEDELTSTLNSCTNLSGWYQIFRTYRMNYQQSGNLLFVSPIVRPPSRENGGVRSL